MKLTKNELKEMIREALREELMRESIDYNSIKDQIDVNPADALAVFMQKFGDRATDAMVNMAKRILTHKSFKFTSAEEYAEYKREYADGYGKYTQPVTPRSVFDRIIMSKGDARVFLNQMQKYSRWSDSDMSMFRTILN